MLGKLIVIEGLDGSGKATQTQILYDKVKSIKNNTIKVSFPNYEEPSSVLVKMYLAGEFGEGAEDTNSFAASSFYSVDRFASYRKHWSKHYLNGGIVIADRYTTSNMVHQTTKQPYSEWDNFLEWLEDFEYGKLGLPSPDLVIYLDMDPEVSKQLIKKRYHGEEDKEDIHESNFQYLLHCRDAALYASKKYGWKVVHCSDGQKPYSIEEIANKVWKIVENNI